MSLNTPSSPNSKNVQTEPGVAIYIDVIHAISSSQALVPPSVSLRVLKEIPHTYVYHMSGCMQRGLEVLLHDLLNSMFVLAAATAREWALTSTNPEAWPSTSKPTFIGTA
jgi:hypothetical protein